jgi:DnaJ-domain-containing protein 1
MADRSTLQYWGGRFALGIGILIAAGLGVVPRVLHLRDPLGLATMSLGFLGFYIALTAVSPMTRILGYRGRTRKEWGEAAQQTWDRASLPRRIYYLLFAVAQADGPITQSERDLVRTFLLPRFPVGEHEIRAWERQPLQVNDRVGLAARVAVSLDEAELDTLFCWCAMVAFADGRFRPDEHAALHEIARGLDIPQPRARMLFHLARAQFLSGARGARGPSTEPRPANPRVDALAALGLPAHATEAQVRRRHRELVRKFHPDAQPNLGEAAQKEATDRFRAIQRAYEVLTKQA